MTNFSKSTDCPTSLTLVAFQNGDIPVANSGDIRRHLTECEFCVAEVEFYERYPQTAEDVLEKIEAAEIPEPLFQLAEALIGKKRDLRSLDKLRNEIDRASEIGN
ncbi:MAG: hypothetical protein H0V76_09765 [Blastocatellia bacterium]|nr:hypothetical protein [Blastocatellia bacterium]